MFSFGRILKSCSGGCQSLWSDPNKQTGTYDAVNKDEKEELDEVDIEHLCLSDIVSSQPHMGRRSSWSLDMESPIVRNQSPVIKSSTKTSSLERNSSFTSNSSPIVKTRTPPRDAFSFSSSPIVRSKTSSRTSLTDVNSPVMKSKTPPRNVFKSSASSGMITESDTTDSLIVSASSPNLSSKPSAYGPTVHSSKTSKKTKKANSELALQVVSTV